MIMKCPKQTNKKGFYLAPSLEGWKLRESGITDSEGPTLYHFVGTVWKSMQDAGVSIHIVKQTGSQREA